MTIFYWDDLYWDMNYDFNGNPDPIALCPKQKCFCKLIKSKERYSLGEYKYRCIKCDFKITLNKSIEAKTADAINVVNSLQYKNAEIVNIDGDLIRIQREGIKDDNYWIDAKISKNSKGELQLMVLAGSKSNGVKTQLFLDPKTERLAFDQNNDHPTKIFTKVIGIFKNSTSVIRCQKDN
ncbi:MAG: hypothetical protein ABSE00_07270 [Chitinispirillaceae bacterium]|jgi:hypothetical protein